MLELKGRRVLVLGLGDTGLSMTRWLAHHGAEVQVADTRSDPPHLGRLRSELPQVSVVAGSAGAQEMARADLIAISPGVDRRQPFVCEAIHRGTPVLGDVELFARALEQLAPAPRVLAVTGTNGKSTVTALLAHLAGAAGRPVLAGANLGEPALDLLERPVPELYVLELSSFQLETTHSLATATATVLNVTPDHLDRYDSLDDYAAAKARIFDRCDVAVVNADDGHVRAMPRPGQRVLDFSLRDAAADYALLRNPEPVLACRGEPLVPLAALRLQGEHNAANALAALALSEALRLPRAPVVEALATFGGLPHRTQWVGEVGGVRYVNDSKGTNVGATVAAVGGMQGPLVLIAGGDGKNADFSALRAALEGKVRHAVLIGRDAPRLAAALQGVTTTERQPDMASAVRAARAAARRGDTVLLSPACASLDMYRDFAHRGEAFIAAVRSLAP
jgi:UDP-N-acetylmuramoylalanine--D-glutamate ligase